MENIVNKFKMIVVIGIMLFASYLLGTTQAETVIEVKTIEKIKTVVPNNYINMENVIDFDTTDYGLQLYFNDGTGYYWER